MGLEGGDGTAAHLLLVVLGDSEARGVLGLGLLADRGEHAPHEAALVAAEVEPRGPGDRRGGGGDEEHGEGEGGAGAPAAKHRRGERLSSPPIPSFRSVREFASACGAWFWLLALLLGMGKASRVGPG